MDNLEEMTRYLEKISLPWLNQKETEVMNKTITNPEIEAVIKNWPKKKSPGPDGFTGEFYETFRELMSISSETLSKNCRGRRTSQLILWGHNHPDTKNSKKQHRKRKLLANITDEHRCKNPQQNSSNKI